MCRRASPSLQPVIALCRSKDLAREFRSEPPRLALTFFSALSLLPSVLFLSFDSRRLVFGILCASGSSSYGAMLRSGASSSYVSTYCL